jgi:dihydroxyacetone kinase
MTKVFDDPARYAEDMLAGFAAAHPRHVRAVPGGVVRAAPAAPGTVAVLTGGGSGHYPAFCGVVGPGFAGGSVVGNVFTSPSAAQAHSVAVEAERGGGVLYLFGNYAGDVLNFGLAARQLTDEGIPARIFAVTDDVASAGPDEIDKRRGIAGGFVVFKAASAAAEQGRSLDEVYAAAQHANDRTRSLGVAFAGCTLPGQAEPLFTVPAGQMGLGLGIHGEPGVSESDLPTASELAATLVDGLLAEAPPGAGARVTAILNGLGATKYEELYLLWHRVSRLLAAAGVEVVEPEVGELVTSLDMAGCSLTLSWLDDELADLWAAPADTPAYRKGTPIPVARTTSHQPRATRRSTQRPSATGDAVAVSALIIDRLRVARTVLHEHADELGKLDAVAGDGDHGRGMTKGVDAALAAASEAATATPGALLAAAGDAWAAEAGGTSGALWGAGLRALGSGLPGDRAPAPSEVASATRSALTTIQTLGKAAPGDKTLLDALVPFVTAFARDAETGLSAALTTAALAAQQAAEATARLRPKIGRARPLAERSLGTPDPGAVSLALVLRAIAEKE